MKSTPCVVIFLVILQYGIALNEQCSVLGKELIGQTRTYSTGDDDSDDSSSSQSTYTGQYYTGQLLDFTAPANCTGKGIAWNLCFYVDWVSTTTAQKASLFVYRKTGNDTYTKVNGSEVTMSVYNQYASKQWYCERINLTTPVQILKGDLIGVCLPVQTNTEPLDIFEDYNTYQLYHLSTGRVQPDCSDSQLNAINLGVGNWEITNDVTLNVNLEINPVPSSLLLTSVMSSLLLTPTGSSNGLVPTSPSLLPSTSVPVNTTEGELDNGGSSSSPSLESLVGITVGGVLALFALPLCLLAATFCVSKRCKQDSQLEKRNVMVTNLQYRRSLGETRDVPYKNAEVQLKKLEETQFQDTNHYAEPENVSHRLLEQLKRFDINVIPPEKIKVTKPLGRGHFGQVSRGIWHDAMGMIYEVAVKMSFPQSSDQVKIKLLQEAAVMVQFNHPNIVQLYGVVVLENKVMLVLELAKNGDLRKYLQRLRNISQLTVSSEMSREFLKFSKDVAMGMYYLSRKGFVHRDIAARNMFLTATKICKVGDFGMSRDVANDIYYVSRGGEVPVRWTAPEALERKKFSTATDIWSYGCLLYEVWSVGGLPFEELKQTEVVSKLKAGYRMPRPASCPQQIYELMTQCWHPDPHCRPTFREVLMSLLEIDESPWKRAQGNPCTPFPTESEGGLRNCEEEEDFSPRSSSAATRGVMDMEEIYDDSPCSSYAATKIAQELEEIYDMSSTINILGSETTDI